MSTGEFIALLVAGVALWALLWSRSRGGITREPAPLARRADREGVIMRGDFDEDEYDDDDYYDVGGCNTCGGAGYVVVCIDDMCRGAGECMHGDGEIPCPECGGD